MAIKRLTLFILLLSVLQSACSMPPEQVITRKMLLGTGVYRSFVIEESPEQVLNAINMEGEVVLLARKNDRPVYVKIMATSEGLLVSSYDR